MSRDPALLALRLLLWLALLVLTAAQIVWLPWVSGEFAKESPAEAFMRWPILTLAICGLACVEVAIVCTLRLVRFTERGEVFSAEALRWVDGLRAAFLAGAAVCLATLIYQSFAVAGPPFWMLLLVFGVASGVGLALLMVVMRRLLVRATYLRSEMDAVI